MKKIIKLSFIGVIVLLYSCSPKINSKIANTSYSELNPDMEIIVLESNEELPQDSELIGELKIGDSGFSNDCDYKKVIADAKNTARKNGANIIEVIQLKEPDFASTCYRLKAKIYRNTDPSILSEFAANRELKNKSRLPHDADYAILYFYRPDNFFGSAIGFKIRLDNETVIGRVRNGEKFKFETKDFGEHTFWGKTETQDSVVINIEKGQEYFVRCSIKMGAAVGRPEINLTENYIGINEYEKMK